MPKHINWITETKQNKLEYDQFRELSSWYVICTYTKNTLSIEKHFFVYLLQWIFASLFLVFCTEFHISNEP